jgi:acetoin utilization deacetylase AcuC-like enzyme
MRPRLFYTDNHILPLPVGHKFPIQKYRLLREALEAEGIFALEPAPFAERAVIELVHDPAYVEAFLGGTLDASAMRRIGFPWSQGLVDRTLASVGSTLSATRVALAAGWGGTLAGGTHHAFVAEGSGFCVFNDIAVAARWLQHEGGLTRIAVIDLDVHQGDGTAQIFADDPRVLTLSVHCKNNFPLRKQKSRIDVELNAGAGDEEYLRVLENVLPQVWEFQPQAVFYQSAVDGLASDLLGHLELTHTGLARRDSIVMGSVRAQRTPLVITLGGGYSQPVELTVHAHAQTFRTAYQIFQVPAEELNAHPQRRTG